MIGFRASSQSSKRGQTWVSIQRVLIPYLCHKSRAPNFRPRTGFPPGNFVAKACRSTCMNSDDVIKCFLAYLCHKSQAPGNLQQRHVKDYVCELWCADSHFRCLWAYHSGMKMPEQTNVIVWAKINSRRLLCMMAWSRMIIYIYICPLFRRVRQCPSMVSPTRTILEC